MKGMINAAKKRQAEEDEKPNVLDDDEQDFALDGFEQ